MIETIKMGGGVNLYHLFKKIIFIGKNNIGESNFLSILKDKILNKQKQPINLIFCWTPLQMVIAEKIIDLYPNEEFYCILISESKNDTFEYYFNKLKNKSKKAYCFYMLTGRNYTLNTFLELKIKGFLLPKVKNIFIASIDRPEFRIIMSCKSNFKIKTFDDGTINLVKNSPYLSNDEPSFFQTYDNITKKIYKLLNPNYNIKKVTENSIEHYTIFKNMPNIMNNGKRKITHIELFENNLQETKPTNEIGILIGNPEDVLKIPLEKAVSLFDIKYFAPHPRQIFEINNVEYIKTPLLIEDYILQQIEENPQNLYHIYTFFSGAILLMKDFPNVKITALRPKSFSKDYWLMPIHQLYEKAQIPIKVIDD